MFPPPENEIRIIAGEAWTYELGQVFDWEGDKVSVDLDLRNAASFVEFDRDTMTLSIAQGATDQQTQPVFDIRLTLSDDHPEDPLSKVYDIILVIVKDRDEPILEIIEKARKAEVINTFGQERVFDLSATSVEQVTEQND